MAKGIFGRKLGMTQMFDESGKVVPVTVIEAEPCSVHRVKTEESDGYRAVVVAVGPGRRANKPLLGQLKGESVPRYLRELRLSPGDEPPEAGSPVSVDTFSEGERVDIQGRSKGHGFAGSMKRHNFRRGPMAHGSKYHRGPGSLSARMSGGGGKVFKGRKLPGRYGNEQVTVRNLPVVKIDSERQLMLVRGAVPGRRGTLLRIILAGKGRRALR